jgi:antitoxin (DNA-binding transcriptional repressor) of toxin-antitoxin stability system
VDITNRGRLVAQLVPARQPDSPLERWIAAGVIERAEERGSILDVEPYPAAAHGQPTGSESLEQMRSEDGEEPR